jgi:hypothetical protein
MGHARERDYKAAVLAILYAHDDMLASTDGASFERASGAYAKAIERARGLLTRWEVDDIAGRIARQVSLERR